jgi:hypothetical protein
MSESKILTLMEQRILSQAADILQFVLNQNLDIYTGSAAHGTSLPEHRANSRTLSPTPDAHHQLTRMDHRPVVEARSSGFFIPDHKGRLQTCRSSASISATSLELIATV